MRSKITLLALGSIALASAITLRLIHLQVLQMDDFWKRSERNFLRVESTVPLRGDIVDIHGTLLATNRPVIDICWQPGGKRTSLEEINDILAKVGLVLEQDLLSNNELIVNIRWGERIGKTVCLARDISFEELGKIKELFADHSIIITTHRCARYYPYQTSACHLLGYLSIVNQESTGKMGLEKLLNTTLKGEHGQTLKTINAVGRSINEVQVRERLAGKTVQTTLDMQLQAMVEESFPAADSGSFILMDPETGALLALISRPAFDPSLFLHSITHQQWQELQERKPFINRALEASYPPGSIFKLVSMSAGIENSFINRDGTCYCYGYSSFYDRRHYCNKREGHGKISMMQALAHSCNIPLFEMGKKVDIDLLASYAHTFGLGRQTGISLPENTGLVPTRAWKRRTKGESWWQGETLSVAIGQSYLLVTPIQVARMIAAIFTGYLVTPRILMEEPIKKEGLSIQSSTIDFLKASMRSVVTIGTGRRVNQIRDMEIYAKTSTAQTSSYERREDGISYLEHGWFVSHFNYKNQKPLVMVVLLENVGTSRAATAVARDFLLRYKKFIDENTLLSGRSLAYLHPLSESRLASITNQLGNISKSFTT